MLRWCAHLFKIELGDEANESLDKTYTKQNLKANLVFYITPLCGLVI